MLVTITQFRQLARDEQNNVLPWGKDRAAAAEARTTVGAFAALEADAAFVRLATDTAIQLDIEGGTTNTSDELFLPGEYYLAVDGGEVLTIAAASAAATPISSTEFLAANRVTITRTAVASAAVSTSLILANAARKSIAILNTDSNVLYLNVAGGAATTADIPVQPNQVWENQPGAVPTNEIRGIWAADGAGSAIIYEGA